jgi:hypothetical protein
MFDEALKKIQVENEMDSVYIWRGKNYNCVIGVKAGVKEVICQVYSPYFWQKIRS